MWYSIILIRRKVMRMKLELTILNDQIDIYLMKRLEQSIFSSPDLYLMKELGFNNYRGKQKIKDTSHPYEGT